MTANALSFEMCNDAIANVRRNSDDHPEQFMTAFRNCWLWGFGSLLGLACITLLSGAERSPDAKLKSGIDRANFDESVKPGDNFFEYVNGNWIRHNPVPAEYSRWGSFSQLHDDNLVHLREIVEGLAKETGPLDENRRKIRDFYATAMDEAKLEKVGAQPLKDELDRIGAIKNRDDLVSEIGRLHATGIGVLFGVYVSEDEKQSTRYIVYLHQGGLSLPERRVLRRHERLLQADSRAVCRAQRQDAWHARQSSG